jgi:hypothetical protein
VGAHAIALSFRERLVGPVARGADTPRLGAARGRAEGTLLVADLTVTIEDLAACIVAPNHPARLAGRLSFAPLVRDAAFSDGTVELYVPDPETGMKRVCYRAGFVGDDGSPFRLEATTFIRPRRASVREQRTAFARIVTASSPEKAGAETVAAAGVLVLPMRALPSLVWSTRARGATRVRGLRELLAFRRRELSTPVPALAT